MATSTSVIGIHTRARPEQVYAALTDLSGFAGWLPRSAIYRGTTVDAGGSADYVDRTPLGELRGRIEHAEPPRRIVFDQRTGDGALSIRIEYALRGWGTGTELTRTGTITTAGRLRPLHPLIVAVTRRENRRTLNLLRDALDGVAGPETHPLSNPSGKESS